MSEGQRELIFKRLLAGKSQKMGHAEEGVGFAPSNIALVKYWGKRDPALNLPNAPSVSLSLSGYGVKTRVKILPQATEEQVFLNGKRMGSETAFCLRLKRYLNEIRLHTGAFYHLEIQSEVPVAAGLASSAAGFAALVRALNDGHGWQLDEKSLAILARLGSGSATRSLSDGFVLWPTGDDPEGMDSYGRLLDPPVVWPTLRMGLLLFSTQAKRLSSRDAMRLTQETSPFYACWPMTATRDAAAIVQAIQDRDFQKMGEIAEANAMALHAIIRSARPGFTYDLPETLAAQQQIQRARQEKGIACYFTQDAGPNLKLLFEQKDEATILSWFPDLQVVRVFQ